MQSIIANVKENNKIIQNLEIEQFFKVISTTFLVKVTRRS